MESQCCSFIIIKEHDLEEDPLWLPSSSLNSYS